MKSLPTVGFVCLFAVAGTSAVEAQGPPRYEFKPGQEITYRSTGSLKYGEGENARERRTKLDWTLWVVRPNPDGSVRMVIRQQESSGYFTDGKVQESPGQGRLVYADVFPDGRVLPNATIRYQGHPGGLIPGLPKDTAGPAEGWSWEHDGDTITAKPVKSEEGFAFETVKDSPMNEIYLSTQKATYTFDPERGLITSATSASTQRYGFNGKGTGETELLGVKEMDPKLHEQLATQESKYFESLAAYDGAVDAAREAGEDSAEKLLGEALTMLEKADAGLTHPALKEDLASRLERHEQSAKYSLEEAKRRAEFVGKAAEAFETEDIDGKEVKLADLKGKVVVLDFWYRGCGWCIKAMPQMNGLAEDFAGKPVAIFGMNTDREEEDARFVIEKMALKYPTLKATGLPEKFGVQGFPTLIVIDRQGNVHDMHVGYTPTLREDVGRQIKALLEK